MTRYDFKVLASTYREEVNGVWLVNYRKMSKDLGLHTNKIAMIQLGLFKPTTSQPNIVINDGMSRYTDGKKSTTTTATRRSMISLSTNTAAAQTALPKNG